MKTMTTTKEELNALILRTNALPEAEALDSIYEHFSALQTAGRFSEIDQALKAVDTDLIKTDVLIAILTITSHAKTSLPARPAFFFRAKDSITRKGENDEPDLFEGLE